MTESKPLTVMCTYRVRTGKEDAFLELLQRHWPTLRQNDLATTSPAQVFRGTDSKGRPYFVEVFSWLNEKAISLAHETPSLMAVWEPMGALCEEREGRPGMEFPHVEPLSMSFDTA